VTPSQACFLAITNKTSSGFNVVLTPTAGSVTLQAGTIDVVVVGQERWSSLKCYSSSNATTTPGGVVWRGWKHWQVFSAPQDNGAFWGANLSPCQRDKSTIAASPRQEQFAA
jgi:hypothetical protein